MNILTTRRPHSVRISLTRKCDQAVVIEVSSDGLIIECRHHFEPGETYTVACADDGVADREALSYQVVFSDPRPDGRHFLSGLRFTPVAAGFSPRRPSLLAMPPMSVVHFSPTAVAV